MDRAKLLVVDDHPIVRRGLVQLINQEEDLVVCGEACDAAAALEAVEALRPDLAIVDISLGDVGGLELIKWIRSQWPDLPMLALSIHSESLYAERALRAGAQGYVMKQEATEIILSAIRRVLRGEVHVSAAMQRELLHMMVSGRFATNRGGLGRLTDRELEIFRLIGSGQSSRQIADGLGLSVKTIESYREHIKKKLDLHTAMELAQRAAQWMLQEDGTLS